MIFIFIVIEKNILGFYYILLEYKVFLILKIYVWFYIKFYYGN